MIPKNNVYGVKCRDKRWWIRKQMVLSHRLIFHRYGPVLFGRAGMAPRKVVSTTNCERLVKKISRFEGYRLDEWGLLGGAMVSLVLESSNKDTERSGQGPDIVTMSRSFHANPPPRNRSQCLSKLPWWIVGPIRAAPALLTLTGSRGCILEQTSRVGINRRWASRISRSCRTVGKRRWQVFVCYCVCSAW